MPILPHQNPVEPDSQSPKDPIHHPHDLEHPIPESQEEDYEEKDGGSDSEPWWM